MTNGFSPVVLRVGMSRGWEGKNNMTKRKLLGLLAIVLITMGLIGGAASPASATEVLKLSLSAHLAEPPVFDPATSTLRLHLTGTGDSNVLGPFTVDTRVVQKVLARCATTTTRNVFSAAGGELWMSGNDVVCPDGSGGSTIRGHWRITGGTGAYAGATGRGVRSGKFDGSTSSLTFIGLLNR